VPIEWTGDDPGKGARKAAEKAWPAVAGPDVAAATIARAALVRLQADGYYTASVEPHVTTGEGRVEVRLRVSRGPKGRGVDLDLGGNTALDDATLRTALPKAGSLEFFEALDPRSTRISNDVRLAYAARGYLRTRVGAPRTAFDAASGRLGVTIPIREGGPSVVAGVDLPEEAARATDLKLKLEAGEPFDLGAYLADRDALGAWYRAQGWIEAQVGGVLEARGRAVSVRYVADAGPRPRVAEVRVEQAVTTRESLVRGSLAVREGDLVRPEALAESRERLSELGVFRSADVRAEPHDGDTGLRDIVVGVVEKSDVQLEYGLRYTTTGQGGAAGGAPSTPEGGRIQVAGAIELTNPFGFGVKTRAYGFTTTNRQSVGVNLDSATLLGHRVRTQLFVFDDRDEDVQISGLTSHVKGVTLQQTHVLLRDRRTRRWHDRLRLQWGYTFKKIDYVESAESSQVLHGNRGFPSLAAIRDERDSLTDPTRGVFWTATTELARTALGSDVNYVRLYGQFFAYVPLGPLVWAQGYRIGAVPGDDPLLLIENRFHAGGPTTVRGFEQNGLGPQTAEGDSLGGQAVAIVNQELRFPIWKSLKGGAFWDAGNVWVTSSQLHLGDLRHSIGVGLRYGFPFGPIRIDYAWILGRQTGEPAGRIVFGLGHAF
jgi:outer membrane protein assembly complex protein YaeT